MKLDKKETDRISALALLVVARKLIRCKDIPMDAVYKLADSSRAEISNMLVEHLTPEQIADIAAGSVTGQVGKAVEILLHLNIMMTGKFHMEAFIDSVESFCSDRLERPVKVVEEDKP